MAYILGEAALRVFPNMENFHQKLKNHPDFKKSKDEEIEIKVTLDRKKFNEELKTLRDDIRAFEDRNTIDIEVKADTAKARRNVDMFRGRMAKDALKLKVQLEERSLDRAQNVFDSFKSDNDTVETHLLVNRNHADDEMADFRAKQLAKPIVQNIIYARGSMPKLPPMKPQRADPAGQRQVATLQREGWNVINMWGRMWDGMNDQINEGIISIYDPYRAAAAKIGQEILKPFHKFNNALQGSESFTSFFSSLKENFSRAGRDGDGFFTKFQNGAKRTKAVTTDFILSSKMNWEVLKSSWQSSGLFSKMAGQIKQIGGTIGGWAKAAGRETADMARTVGSRFSGMVRGIGTNLKEVFTGMPSFLGNQMRLIAPQLDGAMRGIGRAFNNTFGQILSGWGGMLNGMVKRTTGIDLGGVFKKAGDGIFQAFTLTWLAVSGTFGPFMKNMRAVRDGIISGFQGIPRAVGRSFRGIGTLATRAFGGIGKAVSRVTTSMRGAFGGFFKRAGNNFRAFGRFAAGTFQNIGRVVGPVFRKMGGMANRVLFKGMRKGFNMMGRYAAGFGQIAIGAFAKVAGVMMSALMPALMAVMAGFGVLAGAALLGGIMALGGAILSVAQGALLMAPALLAAAGISFVALKIGLEGVGEGIKSAFSAETVADFEEAIAGLPAGAQEIARAFRDSKAEVDALKESVQTAMTRDLGGSIRSMMDNLLPSFSEGMTNMAGSWNNSIRNVLDEMSSDQAGAGLEAIMQGVTDMSREMEPVLANLARAFGSLLEQGAAFMGPMGTWMADATDGFAQWAEGLKEIDEVSGKSKFDMKIENAAKNAAYLGDIFGGLFRTIGNVFAAGAEGGEGMLAGMANSMQRLADHTSRGNEGWDQLVEFMQSASEAASLLGDLLVPVFGIITSVGVALFDLGAGAIPGVTALADGLLKAMEPIKEIAGPVGKALGDAFGALAPFAAQLGEIIAPVISGLIAGLSVIIQTIGGVLNSVGPQIAGLAESLAPVLLAVGEAIARIFVGLQPYLVSTFNVLSSLMGPLGLVFDYLGKIAGAILDALAPLFTGHDAALGALLDNLKPVIHALGIGLLGVINALKPALKAVGDGFNSILEAVAPLLPVLGQALKVAFDIVIEAINWLTPLIPPLVNVIVSLAKAAIPIVIDAVMWLVETVRIYWPIISEAIGHAIQNVILPIIRRLADFVMNTLIPIIIDLWQNVVLPAFNGIAAIIKWALEVIVIPLFNLIVWVVQNVLAPVFFWLIDHVITPVFKLFVSIISGAFDFIQWAIDHVVSPALNFLGEIFQGAVDGIKRIWDGIKKVFADPITFFIETVVNKGVVGSWNKVMGFINKEDDWGLDEVKVPAGLKFASGGVLPGYTPGKDIHDFVSPTAGRLALSGGEAIMRPEWTQAVGGPRAVKRMNEDARHGRIRPPGLSDRERKRLNSQHSHSQGGMLDLGGFASGGVLEAMAHIVGQKYPQLVPIYSGYRPGGPYHGTSQAGDFSNGTANTPAQNGLAHDIAETYPGSAELIYEMPGFDRQINNGSYVGAGGGSYGFYAGAGNHANHVHWAMTEPPTMPFGGGVFEGGSGGGGGGGLFSPIMGIINKILDPIKDKIKSFTEGFGQYGRLALGFGQEIISKGVESLKNKVTELIPGWMRGGSGGADFEPGAGAEQWRAGVIAAFERQGEDPREDRVDALIRQIHTESKGNPNIAQQIVDSNGTGASAGLGLYQFIPSTFSAYRDPGLSNDRTDPDASHNAAVRYFRDRHNWNTGPGGVGRGHGWKTGGVLPDELNFFDRGGEATGVGQLEKNVLAPERVLSPNQTRAFNDFVYGFLPTMIEDYRRRPYDINTAVDKLINGWGDIQADAGRRRDNRIDAMSEALQGTFEARESGTLKVNVVDSNFDQGWLDRNGQKVSDNLAKAVGGAQTVMADPWGYLEAERLAKERMEAEKEAEREKAKEESDAAAEERKAEEDKLIQEKEQAELDAASSEEEKEKIREEHEAAREERNAAQQERDAAASEREQAEDDRIAAAKESGEYYYGYKVFGEGASNPNEYEASPHEEEVLSYIDAMAAPLGLEGPWGKISEKMPVFQELGAAVQTATPAWIAAANGDPSGLQHNIAVSQAAMYEQREAELRDLGPSAMAGAFEALASTSALNSQQPFIGELHQHGMSDAEFARRMDYWQAKQARQKSGTMRTR